jgi:aspartate/methionine/tyrosine aminotransferase/threonine dehydratase
MPSGLVTSPIDSFKVFPLTGQAVNPGSRFVEPAIAAQDVFFPAKARAALPLAADFTRRTGLPVISLGTGIATHQPAQILLDTLHSSIDDKTLKPTLSPAVGGFDFFKSALRQYYAERHGVTLADKTPILPVAGGNQGLMTLLGDVLRSTTAPKTWFYPVPGYMQTYVKAIKRGGNHAVPYYLQDAQGQPIDMMTALTTAKAGLKRDGLKRDGLKTAHAFGGVIVNEPSNPMGTMAPAETLKQVSEWTAQQQGLVISDFAYGDVTHGQPATSMLAFDPQLDHTVELSSISKFHGLSALRTGYVVGPSAIVNAMANEQEFLFTSSGIPAFFQQVAAKAFTSKTAFAKGQALNRTYNRRVQHFQAGLKALGWSLTTPPVATSYLWVPVPTGAKLNGNPMDAEHFSQALLKQAGILTVPGNAFGRADHIRLTMVASDAALTEALNRLKTFGFDYSQTPRLAASHTLTAKLSATKPMQQSAGPQLGSNDRNGNFGSYGSMADLLNASARAKTAIQAHVNSLKLNPTPVSNSANNSVSPATAVTPLQKGLLPNHYLKREDLTVIKAYKVRGALFAMQQAMASGHKQFQAVSTGNFALGVLEAANKLQPQRVEIIVPSATSPTKISKMTAAINRLKQQGIQASLRVQGATFDEAKTWAEARAKSGGPFLLQPYDHINTVAGQSTIGHELTDQIKLQLAEQPAITEITVIGAIGGGGLIGGVGLALRQAFNTDPALKGKTLNLLGLRLGNFGSVHGDAVRVIKPADNNLKLMDHVGVSIKSVHDPEIAHALKQFEATTHVKTEGASGMAIAPALRWPAYQPSPHHMVISIVSGGNV